MVSRFGRRIRKGAAGTAVAAAAMAALTASQAPGLVAGASRPLPPGPEIDGGSPYFTQLPPLGATPKPTGKGTPGSGSTQVAPVGGAGIPATVLAAYQQAQATLRRTRPDCDLPWQLLAAIGQVESGQAEGGDVNRAGTTVHRILGPVLAGGAYADIPDTDNGKWDGDPIHDRAVGPMQFIPSTWAKWGVDGNGDKVADPNNIFDAALAAGDYLCAVGGDLSQPANMRRAILGYNHSDAYLRTVESWYEYFLKGIHQVPDDASGTGIVAPTGPSSPKPGTSPSPSPSARPTHSPQPTVSVSGSIGPVSGSPTPTPTGSAPGTPSAPPSVSPTPTCPVSPTGSPTLSPTGTSTPVPPSVSPTGPAGPSPTPTAPCASPSPSGPGTPSPSMTG